MVSRHAGPKDYAMVESVSSIVSQALTVSVASVKVSIAIIAVSMLSQIKAKVSCVAPLDARGAGALASGVGYLTMLAHKGLRPESAELLVHKPKRHNNSNSYSS